MGNPHHQASSRGKLGRSLLIGGLVVVVVAAAVTWHKVIRHELFPRNFGVVEQDRVYRSGQLTGRMVRQVCEDRGIRTIIALNGSDANKPAAVEERRLAAELGVEHVTFDLRGDGRGDPTDYAQVVRLMADPERQPVLIHCAAGAQRTSAAVIIYRHLVQGRPIQDVYPESFDYKHKPDEWILLGYLADNMPEIRAAFESDASAAGGADLPVHDEE